MNSITAPYGFVPLSPEVVSPDWLALKSDGTPPPLHDVPFKDGVRGTLEIEVEAETPIFVRGTADSGEEFFRLSDGRYALPGTALRGALRNIVEVVTFSRFHRVNNHRYAVRDLQNRRLYGQYMADIVRDPRGGRGEPMPLVNAGWLRKHGEGEDATYDLEICDFAKFEYRGLMELARSRGISGFRPGEKQSSKEKYDKWGDASRVVEAEVEWKRPDSVGGRRLVSKFGIARTTGNRARGTLVMTGQPSRWVPDQTGGRRGGGSAKHHDFVFFEKRGERLPVTREVFDDFEFAHSNRGQQNRLGESQTPNEEWGCWKPRLKNGEPVPVFFLTDDTGRQVASFGLAMMFRLPYKHNIHQAIDNVSPRHLAADVGLDFAEGLFGTVREDRQRRDDGALALKGRVGISHAFAAGEPRPQAAVKAILGPPKASYYPNYVEQMPGVPGGQPPKDDRDNAIYRTWMDPDGAPRGWKRYRAMTETYNPAPPTGADGRPLDGDRVGTRFHPLPAGTRFRAHVDVHNLKPAELGALLWALDFGGDEQARHTLGMARPLGYGRCRVTVTAQQVVDMQDKPVDLAACRQAFADYMESAVPGWRHSPQLKELVALARPVNPKDARYQRLDPGSGVDEFRDAKKPERGWALPSAAQHPPSSGGNGAARRPAAAVAARVELKQGGQVRARVLAETTKKGDPKFEILGLGQEGIFHPSSTRPEAVNVGDELDFIVMSTGRPVMLKWLDPAAPPPPPPRSRGGDRPRHPRGPGGRR